MKKYDNELSKRINANIDADYAKFHSALILGKEIKGVRIPVLRQIAKEFAVYDDFLQNVSLNSYENISIDVQFAIDDGMSVTYSGNVGFAA